MFIPISINDFITHHQEANPGADAEATRAAIESAVQAKQDGARCAECGDPIWAAGSAVAGKSGCFTCITGERDNSDDFEIDSATQ